MKILLYSLLLGISINLPAQDASILQEKWSYHLINQNFSRPTCAVEFPNGRIMVGIYHSMMNNYNEFSTILVLDSAGNKIRSVVLSDTMNNYVYDMSLASDTTAIIVGKAGPLGQNGTIPGDIYIAKLNVSGDIIWSRKYGSSDADEAKAVIPDGQGGAYVCGRVGFGDGDVSTYYGNRNSADIWTLHIDASGNILWQQTMGGSSYDRPYAMLKLADGGLLILGESASYDGNIESCEGGFDALMFKLDTIGNLVWKYSRGTKYNDTFIAAMVTDSLITAQLVQSEYVVRTGKTKREEFTITMDQHGEVLSQRKSDPDMIFENGEAYYYFKKDPDDENSTRCLTVADAEPRRTYYFPWEAQTQLEEVLQLHNGDLLLLVGVYVRTLNAFIVRIEN